MKSGHFFKYLGYIFGIIGGLFILSGIIGYFTGEFLKVRNFTWFFWAANTFIMFGIFAMVAYIASKEPK
jgi:hypothetical protein